MLGSRASEVTGVKIRPRTASIHITANGAM